MASMWQRIVSNMLSIKNPLNPLMNFWFKKKYIKESMQNEQQYLTSSEIANRLGVSSDTIRRWSIEGKL